MYSFLGDVCRSSAVPDQIPGKTIRMSSFVTGDSIRAMPNHLYEHFAQAFLLKSPRSKHKRAMHDSACSHANASLNLVSGLVNSCRAQREEEVGPFNSTGTVLINVMKGSTDVMMETRGDLFLPGADNHIADDLASAVVRVIHGGKTPSSAPQVCVPSCTVLLIPTPHTNMLHLKPHTLHHRSEPPTLHSIPNPYRLNPKPLYSTTHPQRRTHNPEPFTRTP
jgi:hypothetical protein